MWFGWSGIRVAAFSLQTHWSIVLGSMCVGDSVWLSWSGIRVAGFSLQPHWSIVLGSMCIGDSVWLVWSGIRVDTTPTHIEPRTIRPIW